MSYIVEKNIYTHGMEINIKNEKDEHIYSVTEGIYFNKKILNIFDKNDNKIMYIEEDNTNLNTYNIYIDEKIIGNLRYNILFFKYNFEIEKKDVQFQIEGDCSSMEFDILKEGRKVAKVSKRSILISDAYEIELFSNEDEKFLLAIITSIDYLLYDIGNVNNM